MQDQQPLQITGRSDPVIETLPLRYLNSTRQSISNLQDDDEPNNNGNNKSWSEIIQNAYTISKNWFSQQENKGLKLTLIGLLGCILTMFWYFNAQFKEFQQLSQVFALFPFFHYYVCSFYISILVLLLPLKKKHTKI